MRKLRLTLVATCAVAAAATPLASPTMAAGAGAGASRAVIPWKSCGQDLQCARVSVPLNWHRPQGGHIKLAVIRRLASDQKHLIGSMFVNPGGPGQSGVGLVRSPASGNELLGWGDGRFNLVSWDPRGTNGSDPVRCFTSRRNEARFWQGVQVPTALAQSRAYVSKATDLARRCGQVSGPLLDNISTEDTARDLNYLRQVVGDPTLTYVGLSYGTFIGETYASMFPDRVRAMMLDAVINPVPYVRNAEAKVALSASSADTVFAQFLKLCQAAGPARCALARHAPESAAQRVARLFQRARLAPIPAPHADPPGVLSYSDLLLTTFTPLRSPTTWPQYARELDAAASGDASALEMAARAMRSPAAFAESTTSAAIQCADTPASDPVTAWAQVIGHVTRVGRLWGPYLGWAQWAPCAANWPGHATERYTGPWDARTKAPILLINNRYDPATGYAGAQRAARLLGNAVLLTVNSYGHPSYALPSACVDRWRVRYLVHLVAPPTGTQCGAQRPFR